jgi:hypothetical protein
VDDFLMRGLALSVAASVGAAKAGSCAMKSAKQKKPGKQRFSITFELVPVQRFPRANEQ